MLVVPRSAGPHSLRLGTCARPARTHAPSHPPGRHGSADGCRAGGQLTHHDEAGLLRNQHLCHQVLDAHVVHHVVVLGDDLTRQLPVELELLVRHLLHQLQAWSGRAGGQRHALPMWCGCPWPQPREQSAPSGAHTACSTAHRPDEVGVGGVAVVVGAQDDHHVQPVHDVADEEARQLHGRARHGLVLQAQHQHHVETCMARAGGGVRAGRGADIRSRPALPPAS